MKSIPCLTCGKITRTVSGYCRTCGPKARIAKRFWEKVNKHTLSGCWEWTASLIDRRYGQLWVNRTNIRAHRLSWEMRHGQIPDGLVVMHMCDKTICVNPDHLQLGTIADNNDDKMLKDRQGLRQRLSDEEREEIRSLRAEGVTKYDIAEIVGTCIRTVDRIIGPDTRNKAIP